MSIKRLLGFLNDINAGKPIHYPRFLAILDTLNLDSPAKPSDFNASKVNGDLYHVSFVSNELASKLSRIANIDTSSRAGLSKFNRTHDICVSGSFIIVRQLEQHPFVVLVDENGSYTAPTKLYKECVILENLQNFLEIRRTIDFLIANSFLREKLSTDFIYASGASITNSKNTMFFKQYQSINLLLDLDLGGLSIAKTLINRHSEDKVKYWVPENIKNRLDRVDTVVDAEYLKKIEKIGATCEPLKKFVSIIRDHRKILEQENYLNG